MAEAVVCVVGKGEGDGDLASVEDGGGDVESLRGREKGKVGEGREREREGIDIGLLRLLLAMLTRFALASVQ